MDVVTGANSTDISWHKNTSFNPFTYIRGTVGGVTPAFTIVNGDFDNDGDTDLVVSNGEFWWYENKIEQETVSTLDFSEAQFTIFPNPFQDFIQIKNLKPLSYRLELSTISGKIVYSRVVSSENINLSRLESGIYFLSLINIATHETHSTQLIKMK